MYNPFLISKHWDWEGSLQPSLRRDTLLTFFVDMAPSAASYAARAVGRPLSGSAAPALRGACSMA